MKGTKTTDGGRTLKEMVTALLSAKSNELDEDLRPLVLALEKIRTAPMRRPEIPDDERQALAKQLASGAEAFIVNADRNQALLKEAERRRDEAVADVVRLYGVEGDHRNGWTYLRDDLMKRLWAGRPALADELIAQLMTEAGVDTIQRFEMPHDHESLFTDPHGPGEILDEGFSTADASWARYVSNSESYQKRVHALRRMAEAIGDLAAKGASATELQEFYDNEYPALPQLEPMVEVLGRDVRGSSFVKFFKKPA